MKKLLPVEYRRQLETLDICTVELKATYTSKFMIIIKSSEAFSIDPEFSHLKRVKKKVDDKEHLYCILCLKEKIDQIPFENLSALGITKENILTQKVPRYAPYTKEQYELWSSVWPLLIQSSTQTIEDSKTLPNDQIISSNMRIAIDLALKSFKAGNKGNACVLIDPESSHEILAVSGDETGGRFESISHCVMNLFKIFNKTNPIYNNGMKPVDKHSKGIEAYHKIETQKQNDMVGDNEDKEELEEEKKSEEDEETKGDDVNTPKSNDEEGPNSLKRKLNESITANFKYETSYYYATNLDLYIAVEPCIMCAMALVHSRIRRVFICSPHEHKEMGGLNEELYLNQIEKLNHKYSVYYNIETEYFKKVFGTV